jgi:hypothetical protein
MASFEERFAAFGRSIDVLIERARSGRQVRPYRSARSRRSLKDRWREWRSGAGERASVTAESVADWRRGLDSTGTRRLNVVMILSAMAVTAVATWMWTRTFSTGLSSQEVQALSKLGRGQSPALPPSPAGGPWWNQATTAPK